MSKVREIRVEAKWDDEDLFAAAVGAIEGPRDVYVEAPVTTWWAYPPRLFGFRLWAVLEGEFFMGPVEMAPDPDEPENIKMEFIGTPVMPDCDLVLRWFGREVWRKGLVQKRAAGE